MITYMTPSRVEYEYNDISYTIQGEALDPDYGDLDFVIYSNYIRYTDEDKRNITINSSEKLKILEAVVTELVASGTRLEIDGELTVPIPHPINKSLRVLAGEKCPQSGYYFTPAAPNSRKTFKTGEVMPVVNPNYGVNIWQWDEKQA